MYIYIYEIKSLFYVIFKSKHSLFKTMKHITTAAMVQMRPQKKSVNEINIGGKKFSNLYDLYIKRSELPSIRKTAPFNVADMKNMGTRILSGNSIH